MATETKRIKGQPYISGNSVYQDETVMIVGPGVHETTTGAAVLINDIWENLLSDNGYTGAGMPLLKVKQGKNPKYWYWSIKYDVPDEATGEPVETTFELEAPVPEISVFGDPDGSDGLFQVSEGDESWSAYWKSIMNRTLSSPYLAGNAVMHTQNNLKPGASEIAKMEVGEHGVGVTFTQVDTTATDTSKIDNPTDGLDLGGFGYSSLIYD